MPLPQSIRLAAAVFIMSAALVCLEVGLAHSDLFLASSVIISIPLLLILIAHTAGLEPEVNPFAAQFLSRI